MTNANDSGPGSLRDVVASAPAGATIGFAPSLDEQTIVLTSDFIALDKDLVIDAADRHDLAVSAEGESAIFNVTAGEEGAPHAVLVRALEPLAGLALMARRRDMTIDRRELTNGPGKLCQALALDRTHYGSPLWDGPLFIADGRAGPIGRSPRINVDYAGAWAARPWRFYERANRYVSVSPRF